MQRHADEGARIIDRLGFLNDAVPAIRHHHERYDGTGYPQRPPGRGDPARRAHHPRRRRARLDAHDAHLPRRAAGLGGASRSCAGRPARSSARGASPRSSGSCRSRASTTRAPASGSSPPRSRRRALYRRNASPDLHWAKLLYHLDPRPTCGLPRAALRIARDRPRSRNRTRSVPRRPYRALAASTRRRSPPSRPASASATRTRRSSRSWPRAPNGSAARRRCASSPPTRRRPSIRRR